MPRMLFPLLLSSSGSSDGTGWYVFGFFVVFFIIFYIVGARRTKNLTKVAGEIGFQESKELPIEQTMLVYRHGTTLSNSFVGTWNGYPAAFFDLQVGYGRSSYEQTVSGFKRDGRRMPPFQMHNKSFAYKVAEKFSHAYLHIEGDPAFTDRYSVRTAESVMAECTEFFDPSIRAYFSQLPPHDYMIEGSDDSVIVYRVGKMVKPEKINEFLTDTGNIAIGLLSQLPEAKPLVDEDALDALLGDEDDEDKSDAAAK